MPTLLRSSETVGCGATIKLDGGEVVYVSIAKVGVLVRRLETSGGFFKILMSNFFGAKLYSERNVYKNAQTAQALSATFPELPELKFKNPALSAFLNAIWNCRSATEVSIVLNEASAKIPELDDAAHGAHLQRAFEAAKYWPLKRSPQLTVASNQVVYSDGVSQQKRLLPSEIEKWVAASDEAEADKPYRIVRVIDPQGRVVWGS